MKREPNVHLPRSAGKTRYQDVMLGDPTGGFCYNTPARKEVCPMLSAVAYVDTEQGAFGSWLESLTCSIFPRTITDTGGQQWVVQPAMELPAGYRMMLRIETTAPGVAPPNVSYTFPDPETPYIVFRIDYLAEGRVAVWIDCATEALDAVCWELMEHIQTTWPTATLEVLSPPDAQPPPTADPQLVTLNPQLMSDLGEKWGMSRLRRRVRVASMVRSETTVGEIAETLEVSTRTIERDIRELKDVRLLK